MSHCVDPCCVVTWCSNNYIIIEAKETELLAMAKPPSTTPTKHPAQMITNLNTFAFLIFSAGLSKLIITSLAGWDDYRGQMNDGNLAEMVFSRLDYKATLSHGYNVRFDILMKIIQISNLTFIAKTQCGFMI